MLTPPVHLDSSTPAPASFTRDEFIAAFPGEGDLIEFKEGVADRKIRETIVAFSNTHGGVVLVGVTDHGVVVGIADPGQAERLVRDRLEGIHNPGRLDIGHIEVDGRPVLALSVARRSKGFSQTHSGAVYVRRGARNVSLIGPDLNRFQREHSFEDFEGTPTPASIDDADPELIRRLLDSYHVASGDIDSDATQRLLREQGFVELQRGRAALTVVGALVLLADPGKKIGRCGIEVLRYRDGESEPDKRATLTGPVDELVMRATSAVVDELGVQSVLVGIQRVDLPRLPEVAVRETVANAVAHRSYEANATHTRVEIRSDGVTVISPGTLPYPVTVEHMRSQQAAGNPKLLEFLRRVDLAGDEGKGVDRIEDSMRLGMLEQPQFVESTHSVTVTLPTRAVVSPEERGWVQVLIRDRVISPDQAIVALRASQDGSVTNSTVRSQLGIDSTEARVLLQQLCDEGVLVRTGSGGAAQYSPADGLGMYRAETVATEQADEVMLLARDREISNADVRKMLGVNRYRALQILNWLIDRGTLERTGTGRGITYRPVRR